MRLPLPGEEFSVVAEDQDRGGDQDDPEQNIFREPVGKAVHTVSPFLNDTARGAPVGSLLSYAARENVCRIPPGER